MLSGCTPAAIQTEVIPKDGVTITGAIYIKFPITNGGTCPLVEFITGKQLAISTVPDAEDAYFGATVANFTGRKTYADVQLPGDSRHSTLYVARGYQKWRAESGRISVDSFAEGRASGTLWAMNLREENGSTTVNVAGTWACQILLPAQPSPSPSPSPIFYPTLPPPPVGTPVKRQVLPPATVLPVVELCSAPVQVYQNGNAGPLYCFGGEINVLTWKFFVDHLNPKVMALGPNVNLKEIRAALCADLAQHITLPEEDTAFFLGAAYYGWQTPIGPAHGFDPSAWVIGGGCR